MGLGLSYILSITNLLNGLLTTSAETGELHCNLCSVSRALQLPCWLGIHPHPPFLNYLQTIAAPEQEMVAVERQLQYMVLPSQSEVLLPCESPATTLQAADAMLGSDGTEDVEKGFLDLSLRAADSVGEAGLREPLLSSSVMDGADECAVAARSTQPISVPAGVARQPAMLPVGWPAHGDIHFQHVWLQYIPQGPFVLQNVSLHVPPGAKVGICGRTGSGKSSLIACLLRLSEVSRGSICIDGVDCRTVPLATLRGACGERGWVWIIHSDGLLGGKHH